VEVKGKERKRGKGRSRLGFQREGEEEVVMVKKKNPRYV